MSAALHRAAHLLRWGLRSVVLHDTGTNLAKVQDAADVHRFEALAQLWADDPRWQRLLAERPRFTPQTADFDALARLPDGTLGRELLRHLTNNGLLGGNAHPDCPYEASDAAAYAKIRFRETHDVRHVLTGMGTSIHDEIVLQAFQLGQFFNWFAVVTMLGGPFMSPRDSLRPRMVRECRRAWEAGRDAEPLFPVYWEELYGERVADLRQHYGVRVIGDIPYLGGEAEFGDPIVDP